MPAPKAVTSKDITKESTKLSASTNVDSELLQAITNSEDGFMRPGAMPHVSAASNQGCKQLLDSLGKARLGFPSTSCVFGISTNLL